MRSTKNNKIYEEVARELGHSPQLVKEVYESMFRFIKTRIGEIDCGLEISDEDFKAQKISFNIPYLGKIYTTHDKVKLINYYKRISNERNQIKKNQTDIHWDINNNG